MNYLHQPDDPGYMSLKNIYDQDEPQKPQNPNHKQKGYPSFQQADSSAQGISPNFQKSPDPGYTIAVQNHPLAQSQTSAHHENDEYTKLDQGWYYCYQIVMRIYVVMTILSNVVIVASIIVAWSGLTHLTKYKDYTGVLLINIITNQIVLIFVSVQRRAMKERNLKKARVAMIGFVIHLAVYIGYVIIVAKRIDKFSLAEVIIQSCILATIFYLLVGSFNVFKFIKRIQKPDGKYQALNDESRNHASTV